jgi:putative hydrolase of the HAD superfamily
MNFETIFFDLDSTLYTESNGLWQVIRKRIDLYLQERLLLSPGKIPEIRNRLFLDHGTTLKGLQVHYDVDPSDYLDFVHDLPLKDYLKPDPELRKILLGIPSRRWVFTNADALHADRVMGILGIRDCFEGMVDVWAMEPLVKPMKDAYTFALEYSGSGTAIDCAFLDDSIRNLAPAKEMGFFTVLVGQTGNHNSADRTLLDIHDLPSSVPEFWEN